MPNYGKIEELKELILYKKVIEWGNDYIVLDDLTIVTIEESEQDCCASAGGSFEKVDLDAVITNIEISEPKVTNCGYEGEESEVEVIVTMYHNQNDIIVANFHANDGNGGYYYSISSFVVKDVHYKIAEC